MSDPTPEPAASLAPRWRPLPAIDRRVVGVLVEKAKTTPDAYPMSLAALRSGCNQKNNRSPLMELEPEDIEESLTRLRGLGAIAEVQGGGRVSRYRHHMYDWLGVDKVELAVMTELLLRGAQTEGELRGRAARMEPIADLAALRPVLDALQQKGLVIALSPQGRGRVVTHALYEERELEKLRSQHTAGAQDVEPHSPDTTRGDRAHSPTESPAWAPRGQQPDAPRAPGTQAGAGNASGASGSGMPQSDMPGSYRVDAAAGGSARTGISEAAAAELRSEIETLKTLVAQMRKDLDELWGYVKG